jgi:Tfp pilus assembly protein PilO
VRRWVIVGVVMAVLLAAAWWFLFISPRNARIAAARTDLVEAQNEESALRAQIAQLHEYQDAEVEYLAALGRLEGLIPTEPLLDTFIDDLYALSESTGVELLNLAPAMPVAAVGSELREITVSATIDGEFFEVLGFLFGVMDMDRLVRVDAIAVSSGQDQAGTTILSVSLSLRLFTLADLLPVAETPGGGGTVEGGGTEGEVPPEAQTTIVPSTIPTTTAAGGGG